MAVADIPSGTMAPVAYLSWRDRRPLSEHSYGPHRQEACREVTRWNKFSPELAELSRHAMHQDYPLQSVSLSHSELSGLP
jgi:hypothetical protein